MGRRADVAVLGSGPAAWATAAACSSRGLQVAVVTPDPDARWSPTYGVWVDELESLDGFTAVTPDGVLAASWPSVIVVAGRRHRLARAYGRVDNERLATALRSQAHGAGATIERGRAVGVTHERAGSVVMRRDGTTVEAVVVVDATGADPDVADRPPGRRAHQAAFGVLLERTTPPVDVGSCVLMDWTGPAGADPTFLHAQSPPDGPTLFRETSLARRPPMADALLRRRLVERVAAAGGTVAGVVHTEHVRIPLGAAAPDLRQRVVAMGAAAGLIHPATGCSVAASLRAALALSDAVVAALDRRALPTAATRAAWHAVWPLARRRARALERFGLEVLARLDRAEMGEFFDAFFGLPASLWAAYLSGTATPAEVADTMRSVFSAAPSRLRMKLALADPRPLARLLAG
jgi:lycopene beta-cyclase